jgi:peptidoglycan/LPS O-acetylase OafA/YrhL
MKYRKDIDGLRALAITFTVLFHAFPKFLPNGFLGVDIFFVISGFLIHSYVVEKFKCGTFSITNFFIRRIKRILPMSLLVLVFVAIIGSLTLFENEFQNLKIYLKAAAGFYINFKLIDEVGYFDVAASFKPLLHYWSLAVEEQFYLIWPFLTSFLVFVVRKTTKKNQKQNVILSLLFLGSLGYFFSLENATYYSIWARAWQILAGALLANYSANGKAVKKSYEDALVIISFGLIAISLFCETHAFAALSCVIGSVMFISVQSDNRFKLIFNSRPAVFFGLISFSLYLWHWPLLSFARIFTSSNLSLNLSLGLIAIAFILSCISYRFIEKPLKSANWDFKPGNDAKLVFPLGIFAACLLFYFNVDRLPKFFRDQGGELPFAKTNGGADSESTHKCLLNKNDFERYGLEWCLSAKVRDADLPGGIVIGDSHAHALYNGITNEIKNFNWQLISGSDCSPFQFEELYRGCKDGMNEVYKKIADNKNIKIVVMDMAHHVFERHSESFHHSELQIIEKIKALADAVKIIYLIRPVPEMADNIYSCIKKRPEFLQKLVENSTNCRMSLNDWVSSSEEHNRFLSRIKDRLPHVILIDPSPVICDQNYCRPVRDEKPLYLDKDHLSAYGSGLVARIIKSEL